LRAEKGRCIGGSFAGFKLPVETAVLVTGIEPKQSGRADGFTRRDFDSSRPGIGRSRRIEDCQRLLTDEQGGSALALNG